MNLNKSFSLVRLDVSFFHFFSCYSYISFLSQAALKLDTPSRVTMTRSMSIVFSFIVQIVALGSMPAWNQWLGAACILYAVFLVCTHTV